MKIQVQIELQDYLNAQKLHMRKSNLPFALLGIALFFFVLLNLTMMLFYGTGEYTTYMLIVLIPAGAVLLFRYVLLPRRIRKIFAQQKELHAPIEMELTADALLTSSQYGQAERPWSIFVRWNEDDNVLVIYHSDAMFTILPKRYFSPEQIEEAKAYLQVNQVSAKSARPLWRTCLMFGGVFIIILLCLFMAFQGAMGRWF
ncbi:MAG: YcxB family protein [Anaerolineales bacterium]|nr:YcxB family protein [Anaerolineales bacterium]